MLNMRPTTRSSQLSDYGRQVADDGMYLLGRDRCRNTVGRSYVFLIRFQRKAPQEQWTSDGSAPLSENTSSASHRGHANRPKRESYASITGANSVATKLAQSLKWTLGLLARVSRSN